MSEVLELQPLPQDHLSWTQINMFIRCPLQYFYRYVEGRKMPPPGALILGTATHLALEDDLKQKIETKKNIPTKYIGEIMDDAWENTVEKAIDNFGEVDWEGEKPGKLKDRGIKALSLYHKEVATKIDPEPEGVEKKFDLSFKNSPLKIVGSIDCLTREAIIDFKTGKRESPQNPEPPGQLILYSITFPKATIREDKIIRTLKPKYQINQWIGLNLTLQAKLLKTINNIMLAIKTGLFYPTPDMRGMNCGYCGYRELCKKWGV